MQLTDSFLNSVLQISFQAGEILNHFYSKSVEIYAKSDNTPVTEADLAVSYFLIEQLHKLTPHIPILSEEHCNIPLYQRKNWEYYWLIDPLDGTQQFIDKSGQFSILITLMYLNKPVFTVVHAPVLQTTYYAIQHHGAYQIQNNSRKRLAPRCIDLSLPLKIVLGSTSNQQKVRSVLAENLNYEFIIYGSSGLKGVMVATGEADCYIRIGKTGEWDTASSEILLEETGGIIFDQNFSPLLYNQRESFINPNFVMVGDSKINWMDIFQFD